MEVVIKEKCSVVMKEECYEDPEMKRTDVQKPVEKTVHDTQYEIVSEKDCRVEQENVCRRVLAAIQTDLTSGGMLY